ncbi:oxidoreductase [Arcanobacterium hippocoleae]
MGFFGRLFRTDVPQKTARATTHENTEYFSEFVTSRQGVRAFYEDGTSREPAAILLIAGDGEWTRRTVSDYSQAEKVAEKLEIELFKVAVTGYPREMREWNIKNAKKRSH